ncbi:hypothetical protein JCM19235_1225 [Vibrio maritimus]|uniref:Uncharacterized protein n=1 Tax=Vibrio maritimus TaxID=990268 RepID=A0A090S8T0_9VIBR|nr:hypothetical protein JCM19235_1225 [Vibrio maritimus]
MATALSVAGAIATKLNSRKWYDVSNYVPIDTDLVNDTGVEMVITARISDEHSSSPRRLYVDGLWIANVQPNYQNNEDGEDQKQISVIVPNGSTYRLRYFSPWDADVILMLRCNAHSWPNQNY